MGYLLVNAGFFFIGTWVRDLIMYLASGLGFNRDMLAQLALWSPLRALSTALVGLLVLLVFGRWLNLAETRRWTRSIHMSSRAGRFTRG